MILYDDTVDEFNKSTFETITPWICERLGIPDEIDICFFIGDLSNKSDVAEGPLRGYTICDPSNRGYYDIYIDNDMHRNTIISTIIHEMVHVYQYINYRDLDEEYAYSSEYVLYYDFMIELNEV